MANKKGTSTTEGIIGLAAGVLKQGVAKLTEVVEKVSKLDTIIDEKTMEIVNLEERHAQKVQSLDQEFQAKRFEFELNFKKDQHSAFDKYINENGLAKISATDLAALKQELQTSKADFEKNVKSEVASQVNAIKTSLNHEFQIKELEAKSEQATMKASLDQKDAQITFLQSQIESLKEELTAQRKLTETVAQSTSIGSINLGGDKR